MLLHYSAFRLIWDWIILILTGYTAIVVPLRLVIIPRPNWDLKYPPQSDDLLYSIIPSVPESLAIADAVIDVLFALDIILNFHTSFVGPGGEVVADPPVIRVHYLSGWFTLDLVSCLPYELIKYIWSVNNRVSVSTFFGTLFVVVEIVDLTLRTSGLHLYLCICYIKEQFCGAKFGNININECQPTLIK